MYAREGMYCILRILLSGVLIKTKCLFLLRVYFVNLTILETKHIIYTHSIHIAISYDNLWS